MPSENIHRKTDHAKMTANSNEERLSLKHRLPSREKTVISGTRDNLETAISKLSSMSAIQLLKVLGIQFPANLPTTYNNNNNNNQQIPSQQRSKQTNVARVPHVVGQSQQQTVQTLSNSEEKNNKKEQLHVDGSKLGQSVTGSNNKIQSNSNGDEFNTQQQISPLYMLTAGMGGQRFSKISTNQQPQTSNQGKIFDPDALMQHMMMSSASSLDTGKYNLKQNIVSSQSWAGQQTGSKPNTFNSMFGQKSTKYNPTSFSKAKMNFNPNSLLLSANKKTPKLNVMYNPDSFNNAQMNFKPDTSKMSAKLSYDLDKLNDYSGMFKPGQMFPVDSMNTPRASHLMFNADILNKKLMDEKLPNPQTLDVQFSANENSKDKFVSNSDVTPTFVDDNFVPGLLYPGFNPEAIHIESHFPDFTTTNDIEPKFPSDANRIEPRFPVENLLTNLSLDSENSTLGTETNITTTPETRAAWTTHDVTATPQPQSTVETTKPTIVNEKGKENGVPNGGFIPEQTGFIPGSLTGDGRSLQMLVNSGMFDPNKLNQHAFHSGSNQISGSFDNSDKNKTTLQKINGFNTAANFDPSSVNQAKMSFNTNQQMGMDGSSGSIGTNYNSFYDANRVNKNSFMNPLGKVQTNNNNISTGMFDNSQFLGHFDPNNVNIESISNSGNKSQSGMEYTGFGGSFNPVDVNKAYFNPNEVNKERMNFNPSEMLGKNPGYNKDTAESYNFDPNKVNDIHMNFIPPFVQYNKTNIKSNSTRPRFIPGLLSGGGADSSVFNPSEIKAGMLSNLLKIFERPGTSNSTKQVWDGSTGGGTGAMFNPSAMMKDMNGFTFGNKFDPNTLNKVSIQSNPAEMMEHLIENTETSTENNSNDKHPVIGHGNHK